MTLQFYGTIPKTVNQEKSFSKQANSRKLTMKDFSDQCDIREILQLLNFLLQTTKRKSICCFYSIDKEN